MDNLAKGANPCPLTTKEGLAFFKDGDTPCLSRLSLRLA
jgi:hypothetical protein